MTLESKHLFSTAAVLAMVLAAGCAPVAAAGVAASRPATRPDAALPPKTLKAVKALLAKAELVVLGKVAAVHDRTARDAGMRYDVEVDKTLKGKWREKSLSFRSAGQIGYAKYTKDQRVLLFLRRWGNRRVELLQLKPVVYIAAPQAGGLDLRPVEKYLKLIKSLQPGGNKLPTERAKLLKKHIGQFMLVIRYYGRQDKDRLYYSLTLQAPTVRGTTRSSFWPAAQLSKAQAEKIIDHLDRIGILAAAGNLHNKGFAPPKGPTYALTITGPDELRLYEPLGWDLKMLKRLEALRKVLDGDAAKAMDDLLMRLGPQREMWQGEARGARPSTEGIVPAISVPTGLYRTGAKIPLTLVLRNTSEKDVLIPVGATYARVTANGICLIGSGSYIVCRKRGGGYLQFKGGYVKATGVSRTLKAGQKITAFTIDLAKCFNLTPGTHDVQMVFTKKYSGFMDAASNRIAVTVVSPVALVRAYIVRHKITGLDPKSGKFLRTHEKSWTVWFTDPEAKARGKSPHGRAFRVNRKTGKVTRGAVD